MILDLWEMDWNSEMLIFAKYFLKSLGCFKEVRSAGRLIRGLTMREEKFISTYYFYKVEFQL